MNNPYEKYKNSKILTASPSQLTLMLYDGAIKFGNIAKAAMEHKEIEEAHKNIMKVHDIIETLIASLNSSYPISKDFKIIYGNIIKLLTKANISKNPLDMEIVLVELRDLRDKWKEIMKRSHQSSKGE